MNIDVKPSTIWPPRAHIANCSSGKSLVCAVPVLEQLILLLLITSAGEVTIWAFCQGVCGLDDWAIVFATLGA